MTSACLYLHEDPFKVQYKAGDFNVTEQRKFTEMVSDSTLQLTFKKLPLFDPWRSIKEYP